MNHRSIPVWCTFALSIALCPLASPQEKASEGIEEGNRRFEAAFEQGDGAAVAALYTESAQLFPSASEIVSGTEAIAKFWQGVMDGGIQRADLETLEVEACGETAYEVGEYTLTGKGGKIADQGKYVVIWKRVNGEWKLHRDIWNTNVSGPTS